MAQEQPPQWLQTLLSYQEQQLSALRDQNRTLQNQHQVQLQQLQAALAQTNDALQQTSIQNRTPSRPKPSLPEPPMFDGDREAYEGWRTLLQNKLESDGEAIGSLVNQFRYVAARLEGSGLTLALTYIQQHRNSPRASGFALLEYLDSVFGDRYKKQRAIDELRTLRQRPQEPFAAFLPRFERVLADAGGMDWPDDVKRSYLDGSLTFELRRLKITMPMLEEYSAYVNELLRISELHRLLMQYVPKEPQDQPDREQTRPSLTNTQRKHAFWVDQEIVDERRRAGHCLRCGRPGHFIRNCTLRPAVRPQPLSRPPRSNHPLQPWSNRIQQPRYAPEPSRTEQPSYQPNQTEASKARVDESTSLTLDFPDNEDGPKETLTDTVEESNEQERKEALRDWKEAKRVMDGEPFIVSTRVNGIAFAKTLIDSGCLAYGTVSERFARKWHLDRISIPPRALAELKSVTSNAITEVAYMDIDLDGHRQQRVFFYVVPDQKDYDLVLGLPWMESQDASLSPARNQMEIGVSGITLWNENHNFPRHPERFPHVDCTQISASAFSLLSRQARRKPQNDAIKLFATSIADIDKMLKPKVYSDPAKKLPAHYHSRLQAFSREIANELPPHRPGFNHTIQLEKNPNGDGKEPKIPWGPLYNMSRGELLVLRKTLTDYLDKNFIRASSSPAAAPVLFAKKPGGGLRFCVDYRALNAISRKDRYPPPLIQETLNALANAKWLTKLDIIHAYHRIRIEKGEEWKTAFRTRYGLFEWQVLPFGLTNAPATFQRYLNWVLREYIDDFCSAYLDDILIFSSGSLADHREKVTKVLDKLIAAGLPLDIDKCEFETKSVKYLGFIIDAGVGIRMDPEKVKAITEWTVPGTVKGVRAFLGFANFYRRFIPGFSTLAAPLVRLTRKDTPFYWGQAEQRAFERLKVLFITGPILAQFDPDKETLLKADSSGWSIGGVLSQYDKNGELHPCAYFSKKNSPAECNYNIHDKELLAIIRCLEEWDSELRSVRDFTILTDHKNLEHFMKVRRLTERQVRWSLALSRYNFKLAFRPGSLAGKPDALSRREQDRPTSSDDRLRHREMQLIRPDMLRTMPAAAPASLNATNPDAEPDNIPETVLVDAPETERAHADAPGTAIPRTIPEATTFDALWATALERDRDYGKIRHAIQSRHRRFPPELKLHVTIAECSLDTQDRPRFRDRLWVPDFEPLRTRLIQVTHDSIVSGHPGRDQLISILSRRFYWPGLSQDVRRFVRNCDNCGSKKPWRERKWGLLKPLPVPERVWREISMDFITGLPACKGDTNCMVITDRLGKGVIFESLPNIEADTVAQRFMHCFYRHHGLPSAITSDRGSQFVGHLWRRICQLSGITQRLSSSYHPETDGATERANQTLEEFLRFFCSYAQDNWAELLPFAELAINNRDSTSTGVSPFFLSHGFYVEPFAFETEPLRADTQRKSPIQAGESILLKLRQARDWAQAAMATAQQRQEEFANRHRQPAVSFRVGDKVWLHLGNIRTDRPSRKLDDKNAKFRIIEVIDSHSYRLNTPPGVENVFHVSKLRPAGSDPLPSQVVSDAQPPALLTESGEEEYEIDRILDARTRRVGRGSRREVLVQWTGYSRPTWEPRSNLEDTAALDAFERRERGGNVTG